MPRSPNDTAKTENTRSIPSYAIVQVSYYHKFCAPTPRDSEFEGTFFNTFFRLFRDKTKKVKECVAQSSSWKVFFCQRVRHFFFSVCVNYVIKIHALYNSLTLIYLNVKYSLTPILLFYNYLLNNTYLEIRIFYESLSTRNALIRYLDHFIKRIWYVIKELKFESIVK